MCLWNKLYNPFKKEILLKNTNNVLFILLAVSPVINGTHTWCFAEFNTYPSLILLLLTLWWFPHFKVGTFLERCISSFYDMSWKCLHKFISLSYLFKFHIMPHSFSVTTGYFMTQSFSSCDQVLHLTSGLFFQTLSEAINTWTRASVHVRGHIQC